MWCDHWFNGSVDRSMTDWKLISDRWPIAMYVAQTSSGTVVLRGKTVWNRCLWLWRVISMSVLHFTQKIVFNETFKESSLHVNIEHFLLCFFFFCSNQFGGQKVDVIIWNTWDILVYLQRCKGIRLWKLPKNINFAVIS